MTSEPRSALVIERAALLVLLALIPLRALLNETHSFEMLRVFRNLPGPSGTQPAATFFITAAIFATAAAVSVARLRFGGRTYLRTGAEIGGLLLLLAAAISTGRAGQKHLALIGSIDFLGLIVYLLTLRQLLTRPWHIRLTLAVVLATGAMVLVKCGYQRWVEFPETITYYHDYQAELLPRNAGEAETAGLLYDYEQRLKGQLVTGYLGHSNVLGSFLILLITTAAAVVMSRVRRRSPWAIVVPALLAGGGVLALVYAQSKGAAAAAVLAALFWVVGAWYGRREVKCPAGAVPTAGRSPLWLVLWIVLALGALGLTGILQVNPQALGRSMLFRHQYWRGAVAMMQAEGPWGVGANNFGRFFPRYKPVECPEDVESPHSWVVQAAAEWGVLGLIGLFAVLVGISRRLADRFSNREPSALTRGQPRLLSGDHAIAGYPPAKAGSSRAAGGASGADGSIALWLAGISAIAFGGLAWQLTGADPYYWAESMLLAFVPWVIVFLAASIESADASQFSDDPPGPLLAGLCAGMVGFLIHAGVDLALFRAGAATTFFALIAVSLALRECRSISPAPAASAGRLVSCAVGLCGFAAAAAVIIGLALPAWQSGRALHTARANSKPCPWPDYERSPGFAAYQRAVESYRLDGTALDELIDELIQRTTSLTQAGVVLDLVAELLCRDPQNSLAQHHRAVLHYQRFQFDPDAAEIALAAEAMRAAVTRSPFLPTQRLALGNLLARQAEAIGSPELRLAAAAEFRKALALDEQRVYVSEPHRLSPEIRAMILAHIAELNASTTGGAP